MQTSWFFTDISLHLSDCFIEPIHSLEEWKKSFCFSLPLSIREEKLHSWWILFLTTGFTESTRTFHGLCFVCPTFLTPNRTSKFPSAPALLLMSLLASFVSHSIFTRAVFMSEKFISISALHALLFGAASRDGMREEERAQSAPDKWSTTEKCRQRAKHSLRNENQQNTFYLNVFTELTSHETTHLKKHFVFHQN